jgi:single-stranded DNA-binding protein
MLTGLLAGTIASTPKSGTSASGTRWSNCVIRCPVGQNKDGEAETAFVSLACFGSDADALAKLDKGDPITAQGHIKPSTYTKDGQERHGLSMMAAHLLTSYMVKKKRGDQSSQPSGNQTKGRGHQGHGSDYDDAIGF